MPETGSEIGVAAGEADADLLEDFVPGCWAAPPASSRGCTSVGASWNCNEQKLSMVTVWVHPNHIARSRHS